MRPAANAAYLPECVKHSGRWYEPAEPPRLPGGAARVRVRRGPPAARDAVRIDP